MRALTTLCVFFVFCGMATTGILRFLDEAPLIATLHMTFAFTMFSIVFFHISNNSKQLFNYLKNDKKELMIALLFVSFIGLLGLVIHFFPVGSEVV